MDLVFFVKIRTNLKNTKKKKKCNEFEIRNYFHAWATLNYIFYNVISTGLEINKMHKLIYRDA